MADVPDFEMTPPSNEDAERQEKLEFRLLEASAKAKEAQNREADQRYILRWVSVILGIAMIIMMVFILFHMSHQVLIGPFLVAPTAYGLALVVVPVTSATTIILALLVAAFRGFKKEDEEDAVGAATNGARASGLIN